MESNDLPPHIFADQQEPVGDRVNSYFKLETITSATRGGPTALETVGEEGDTDLEDDDCLLASTLKLDKLWALDSSRQVLVTPIIQGEVDLNSEAELSWPDEAENPKVDYIEMLIAEGAEFCRESFLGGRLGDAPPPKSSVLKSQKRKAKAAVKKKSVGTSSRAKKTKESGKSASAADKDDCPPTAMDIISEQIEAAMKRAQAAMVDSLASSMLAMSAKAEQRIREVIRDINDGTSTEQVPPVVVSSKHQEGNQADGDAQTTEELAYAGTCPAVSPPNVIAERNLRNSLATLRAQQKSVSSPAAIATGVMADNHKFTTLTINASPERVLQMGEGLCIREQDLLDLPLSIPPSHHEVVDACTMMLQKSWLACFAPNKDNRMMAFDSSASERRGARIIPELQYICQMFPYLVRKATCGEGVVDYGLAPLQIRRDTTVVQSTERKCTGMLTLIIMEAHVAGGLSKAYEVHEGMIDQRAKDLAVEMAEHCAHVTGTL
ncbi:unnamed protein product [Thlaspi arvense]|uniref:Uncharacterized protein n=1 Tax=Thlaspi arvense TaxID=13288 RepID=A0AAU9RPN1_THLAR|nr:unnamed protein product [Thlaspi arvense]